MPPLSTEYTRAWTVAQAQKRWVTMGPGSYCCHGLELLYERAGGQLSIGRFTSIGRNLRVYLGGEHHSEWVTTSPIRDDLQSTTSRGDAFIEKYWTRP